MANPWFRLYSEFSTDPKVQMMSESNQRRLIMLMCIKNCNVTVTLHDNEIAFQLRVTDEEWSATKQVFIDKGFIDKNNNLINWDKRQFSSDSSAARVAKHRKKMKRECNVTVTPPDTDTDTDTERDKGEIALQNGIFKRPTSQEVDDYARDNKLNLTGFFEHYESNGWMVGKNKMQMWQPSAKNWHSRQGVFSGDKSAGKPVVASQSQRRVI